MAFFRAKKWCEKVLKKGAKKHQQKGQFLLVFLGDFLGVFLGCKNEKNAIEMQKNALLFLLSCYF